MEKEGDRLPPKKLEYYFLNENLFIPVFAKMMVKINGTTIATNIATANIIMCCGWIERNPGRPPTPIELAITSLPTEKTAAAREPIIAARNGKPYFKLIPNIAGSVTPR